MKQLAWCWDETEQKVRRFRGRSWHRGVKTSAGALSQQTMVQSGMVSKYSQDMATAEISADMDPIIVKPLRIETLCIFHL